MATYKVKSLDDRGKEKRIVTLVPTSHAPNLQPRRRMKATFSLVGHGPRLQWPCPDSILDQSRECSQISWTTDLSIPPLSTLGKNINFKHGPSFSDKLDGQPYTDDRHHH